MSLNSNYSQREPQEHSPSRVIALCYRQAVPYLKHISSQTGASLPKLQLANKGKALLLIKAANSLGSG